MLQYESLSPELERRLAADRAAGLLSPYYTPDESAVRRCAERDRAVSWRGAFVRDIDKILHCPFYNRYTDKTQVFS